MDGLSDFYTSKTTTVSSIVVVLGSSNMVKYAISRYKYGNINMFKFSTVVQ